MNQELRIKNQGFTLVEIIVSTTIFAVVVAALMSLFNYTLKINRRAEALRQATQGMRNFVEFIVKEVRNGDIDYGVINGVTKTSNYPLGPCDLGGGVGSNTYGAKSNWLGIITTEKEEACVYFANSQGARTAGGGSPGITDSDFTCPEASPKNCTLVMEKPGGVKGIINPPNYRIDSLAFFVRPVCDPLTATCLAWGSNPAGLPEVQPSVTLAIKFVVNLPTGESVPIYYQTTVSSNRGDIPNAP